MQVESISKWIKKGELVVDNKIRSGIIWILFVIIIFGLSPGLNAKSTVQIRAGSLRNEDDMVYLSDGVEIIREDVNLSSPRGEMNREKRELTLTDGVKMDYDQGKIESQQMKGWLNDDRYLFEEDVVFDYSSEENEREFTLYSPYLEMNSAERSFQAEDGVTIDYQDRELKAEEARYSEEDQLLVLERMVEIEEESGDWIKCERAEFDLSSGEESFTADGNVEIELQIGEDEE